MTGAVVRTWTPPASGAIDPASLKSLTMSHFSKLPPEEWPRYFSAHRLEEARAGLADPENKFGHVDQLSDDGSALLDTYGDLVRVWNLNDGTVGVVDAASSAFDSYLLVPNGLAVKGNIDFVTLWKRDGTTETTGPPVSRPPGSRIPANSITQTEAISPAGHWMAVGNGTGALHLWDLSEPLTPASEATYRGFFAPWRRVCAAGNSMVAACGAGILVIDPAKAPHWLPLVPIQVSATSPGRLKEVLDYCAVSKDGHLLAEIWSFALQPGELRQMGVPYRELRVRNLTTGEVLWRHADHNEALPAALAFGNDGALWELWPDGGRMLQVRGQDLVGLTPVDPATLNAIGRDGGRMPQGTALEQGGLAHLDPATGNGHTAEHRLARQERLL